MQKTLGGRPSPLAGPIAAAGTLPRSQAIGAPSRARRARLALEILVVFAGGPLAMTYAIYVARTPLFAALLPVLLGLLAFLLLDTTFSLKRELARGFGGADLASLLAILAVCGGAVALFVAIEMPERFLSMPRNRPGTWRKVLTVYPFLSVLVQEFVYRTFFFHRYGPLFGGRRALAVLASGLLFGFGHVIFRNWVAVIGTALTGVLFAWRYARTGSFWAAWIEHTLWGWLVFTVGLGGFFFTGVSHGWKLGEMLRFW
jgi:membrane protease YdiL (CAAX protease family)